MTKLVSLSLAVGTIVTQKHIDLAYKEADDFPVGSRYWKAFMCYAKSLERRLENQK